MILSRIAETAIFLDGLSAVAAVAEGLMVGRVPKQRYVPAMGHDVVNDRRRHDSPAFLARST